MPYDRSKDDLDTIQAETKRPILLANGCVVTGDPTLGDWAEAHVLIGAGVVVGIGPGLLSAAADDGMIVVECRGCIVMAANGRLECGAAADVVVLRLEDQPEASATPEANRPDHVDIRLVDGRPVIWNAEPVAGAAIPARDGLELRPLAADEPRVGWWREDNGFLQQNLLPEGRYDENRGERVNAYRGRYWLNGDRIDYLDDEGFWAFGEFTDERTLAHAGYLMKRS